jgi:hypothetical protein
MDGIAIYLLTIAVVNMILWRKTKKKETLLIFLLGIMLMLSWFRGVLVFGLETATNDLRTYLYFYSSLLFICSLPFSSKLLRKVSFFFALSGWMLLIIAIVRWILVSQNILASSDWLAPNGWMIPVLPSAAALLILQHIFYANLFRESKSLHQYHSKFAHYCGGDIIAPPNLMGGNGHDRDLEIMIRTKNKVLVLPRDFFDGCLQRLVVIRK